MNLSLNEELKTKLIEYMSKLEQAVQASGDFVSEQAPLVVQEFITYQRASESIYVLSGVILLIFAAFWLKSALKAESWPKDAEFPVGMAFFILMVISLLSGSVCLVSHVQPCLKAWVAPRILIIDYIREGVSK